MKTISIISPVYNEQECVEDFFNEIQKIKNQLGNYKLELIFTNNASQDNTLYLIKNICQNFDWVKLYSFTQNVGYQNSLFCGLEKAKGDFIMMVDVDLEDPPSLIFEFLDSINNKGFFVAYGMRNNRQGNKIINFLRSWWYIFFSLITSKKAIPYMSEFCMITKEVKDSILKIKSSHIFLRNEIAFLGYPSKGTNYLRKLRKKGKAKGASLLYILIFALTGLINSTSFPLRLSSYLGVLLFIIFLFSSLFGLNFEIFKFFLISYMLYFCIIVSAYLSRSFNDLSNKSKYTINKKVSYNIDE